MPDHFRKCCGTQPTANGTIRSLPKLSWGPCVQFFAAENRCVVDVEREIGDSRLESQDAYLRLEL